MNVRRNSAEYRTLRLDDLENTGLARELATRALPMRTALSATTGGRRPARGDRARVRGRGVRRRDRRKPTARISSISPAWKRNRARDDSQRRERACAVQKKAPTTSDCRAVGVRVASPAGRAASLTLHRAELLRPEFLQLFFALRLSASTFGPLRPLSGDQNLSPLVGADRGVRASGRAARRSRRHLRGLCTPFTHFGPIHQVFGSPRFCRRSRSRHDPVG